MKSSLACLLIAASCGYSLDFNIRFSEKGDQASLRILQVPAQEPLGALHVKLRFRAEAGIGSVTAYRAADGAWSQVTPELRVDGNTVELWALAPNIGESRDSTVRTLVELALPLKATGKMIEAADLLDSVWVIEALDPRGLGTTVAQKWVASSTRGPIKAGGPKERSVGNRQAVSFMLAKGQRVHAFMTDVRGKVAAEIFDRKLGPGLQEISWDKNRPGGKPLPAGGYFLRLEAGTFTYARKLEVSP
jgi:hypothetical protein